jgi:hypothetical protein
VKKEREAEKKEAQRERKRERREKQLAEEKEKKERKRERKAEQRERRLEKEEEAKQRRAERRALKRERNAQKREELKLKDRARRVKEKERAKGRRREPGSPPMPRNPISFFMKEKLHSAAGNTMPEKMKAVSAQWKAMSEAEKKPYMDKSEKDKERYAKEFAEWRAQNPEPPKRPLSSYMYFAQEQRKSNPEVKDLKGADGIRKAGQLLGSQWKALSADQKKQYEALAQNDRERYYKAKEQWDAQTAHA